MIDWLIYRGQEHHADALLAQAWREVDHPKPKMTVWLAIGWFLSVVFLATPFIVMAAGEIRIAVTFPQVLPGIMGLIMIGCGVTLLPLRARNRDRTFRPAELPALFVLLHRTGLLWHQIAQKVSEDPMPQAVFRRAVSVMENWRDTFEMDRDGLFSGVRLLQSVAATITERFERRLRGLSFFEQQRAE